MCGAYKYSAIEGGGTTASGTVATEGSAPAFLTDMTPARRELAALRSGPAIPRARRCDDEAAILATPILYTLAFVRVFAIGAQPGVESVGFFAPLLYDDSRRGVCMVRRQRSANMR